MASTVLAGMHSRDQSVCCVLAVVCNRERPVVSVYIVLIVSVDIVLRELCIRIIIIGNCFSHLLHINTTLQNKTQNVYTNTHAHTCTHIHAHTNIHTHMHTHIHTYTYIHIHTHTHTHTHTTPQFRALGGSQVSPPRPVAHTFPPEVHPGGRTPHHLGAVLPLPPPVRPSLGLSQAPEPAEGVPHMSAEATVQAAAGALSGQVWREGSAGLPQPAIREGEIHTTCN